MLLLALPIIYAVAAIHRYLALYAPSNLLIRHVRSGLPRWRNVPMLGALTAVLLIAMHAVSEATASGAPGWLNLVVLVLAWDSIKIALLTTHTALRALAEAIRRLRRRMRARTIAGAE